MTEIAFVLDLTLYGLLFLTVALVVFKCVELAMPARFGHSELPSSKIAVDATLERLERLLALIAVIASTAAFVGLAGTVAHIVTALSNLKGSAMDITLISGPIATSLQSTLLGLASAIPASIAHALLLRRLQVLEGRMLRNLGLDS